MSADRLFISCCQALGAEVFGRQQPADLTTARAGFERLAAQLPDECDAWRGLAASGRADHEVLEHAYRTIATYGDLVSGSDIAVDALDFIFDTGLYVQIPASAPDTLRLAVAATRTAAGEFASAHDLIDSDLRRSQPVLSAWALAVVHFQARRWSDIREILAPLHATPPHDRVLAHAIAVTYGVATAYLGMWDSALEILEPAGRGPIPAAAAEALLVAGLCARTLGREDTATRLLNEAYGSKDADPDTRARTTEALSDPEYGIHPTSIARIEARTDYWNPDTEPGEKEFSHDLTAEHRAQLKAEADAELDAFVGIDDVKQAIARLDAAVLADKLRADQGLRVRNRSHHLVLKGAPGTGKTSMARIVGKRMYAAGVLPGSAFVEVTRADLVDDRIGGTEKKVQAILAGILEKGGGVLFVDEVYMLTDSGSSNDFGPLAVAEIMRAMLDHNDKLMVIIAGYIDRVEKFLDSNEGLRRRFGRELVLRSYTADELVEITEGLAAKADSIIDDPEAVREVYRQMKRVTITDTNGYDRPALDYAGNAGFAEKLIQQAEEERDHRLDVAGLLVAGSTAVDLQTVTAEDVRTAASRLLKEIKEIEFDIDLNRLLDEASGGKL